MLGLSAKIYRNTGTYGSPTWVEQSWIKEHSLELSKGEADATTRANGGWKATVATLKDAGLSITGLHDTSNTNYLFFYSSFYDDAVLDLAIVDGPIATVGTRGLRASFQIMGMSDENPIDDVTMQTFTIKPTQSANAPALWHTAS